MYCCDIPSLIHRLGRTHEPDDWRLFIDLSKRSLKAVLADNENKLASVPVALSSSLKESYENLQMVLGKIKYNEHNWYVCCDLKVCGIWLGQQRDYTKFPCFVCEWDIRAKEKHWTVTRWPERKSLVPGTNNLINPTFIYPQKVLLALLHIKLGSTNQFVKALDRSDPCYWYFTQKFTLLS